MTAFKSTRRTLKAKIQERRKYPDGTTALLEFSLEGVPVSEEYVARDRALLYLVNWDKGFRTESYHDHEGVLNRGEYEAARASHPGMPASLSYEGMDDPHIASISYDYRGYRCTSFKWAPGHIEHRSYDNDGALADGQNFHKFANGTFILEHMGRNGVLRQRTVEGMAADRTGFYFKHVYSGNDFRDRHGEDAEGAPQDVESYQVDRRPANREEYEAARHACPEMPAADFAARDLEAEIRARKALTAPAPAKPTAPVNEAGPASPAENIDSSCLGILGDSRVEAREWMKGMLNTLGEMNRRATSALVNQFYKLGCVNIFVIDIEEGTEDEGDNASGLVIELPDSPDQRAAILKKSSRIAEKQGFTGDKDTGQRFNYIKLD